MTARNAFHGACLAVGGCVGMFAAFYAYFLASTDPASWLARATRPH